MKMKSAWVVTHHYHFESGDVIALFKFKKKAVQYVKDLIKDRTDFKLKDRDDGTLDFFSSNESYEIKCFEVAQ